MAERLALAAEPRTVIGKQVRSMRRDGIIPAVIYGQQEPKTIQMDQVELRRVLRQAGGTTLIDISMGSEKYTVLAREIQQHPTRGNVLHVDFYEVDMKQKIVVDVELVPVGQSQLVIDGLGNVVVLPNSVQIETLPDNLISEIEVDLSAIVEPGDTIVARELPLPDNVDLYDDPEMIIATFQYREEEEEEEEEELPVEGLASIVEEGEEGEELESVVEEEA